MISQNKIKQLLEQRAKERKKISITVNSEHLKDLKKLSKLHSVPLSTIIEVCIEVGLADPYINPEDKSKIKKKRDDDF